jgi:hypothetical protein
MRVPNVDTALANPRTDVQQYYVKGGEGSESQARMFCCMLS